MISKETKETILATIDEVFQKMNSISWIDRQKAMSKEALFQRSQGTCLERAGIP